MFDKTRISFVLMVAAIVIAAVAIALVLTQYAHSSELGRPPGDHAKAYDLSMISAALNACATWDHSNAVLWHRCTDLLATASHLLQQRREPPPEFRPLFERVIVQLRSDPADDLD
jgi:hypothetical protein